MLKTPILIITFNRPNHTRQVWEEIKKQKPKQIFVFQDGARANNASDIEKCAEVRAIFEEKLDWECDLQTFYSETNLGCGRGPASAITWFFENVEEGLIFEDDAVPASDFFSYAEELLERYRNTEKVKVITSINLDTKKYGEASYYFTMMNRNLCAWAMWKRSWDNFDYYLDRVNREDLIKSIKINYKSNVKIREYWADRLDEIHFDRLNDSSWDMQFLMSIWLKGGLGVAPNVNLSTNIGFDAEATHTISENNPLANLSVGSIMPLSHPVKVKQCKKADINYDKIYFQSNEYGIKGLKRLPFRVNKRIKRLFNIKGSWFK